MEVEAGRRLDELRLQAVPLAHRRQQPRHAVERVQVSAGRVDVDPGGEVGEQQLELGVDSARTRAASARAIGESSVSIASNSVLQAAAARELASGS